MSYDPIIRQAAIVNAASARALIRALGMASENTQRTMSAMSPAYTEEAFLQIIEDEGIGYNSVITTLNY